MSTRPAILGTFGGRGMWVLATLGRLGVWITVIATLVACSSGAPPAPASRPATAGAPAAPTAGREALVIASQVLTAGLDPAFAAQGDDVTQARNIYSALLKYKPDSTEVTGDLATGWEVSADGLTYTFHLRQDVEWQKGYGHFTAADVKASFERLLDPATHSPFASAFSMLKQIDVVDPTTVRMVLGQPYAPFLLLLTNNRGGGIVNVRAVRDAGQDYAWNPVGTGPYELASHVPNQEVVLQANPRYYGGPPPIKQVVWKMVPDANANVIGLETGQYDLLFVAPQDAAVVARLRDEGFVADTVDYLSPLNLYMNVTARPWDNLLVRRAVAHAIDRQQYIDLAAPGLAKPWYSPVPAGYFAQSDDVPRYEYDPAKARQLLAQAGYPDGVAVTMTAYTNTQLGSTVLAQLLKPAGFNVTVTVLDNPTFIQSVIQRKGIDFALHCCVHPPDPDISLSDLFVPSNHSGLSITQYDLEPELAPARVELDPAKRAQRYHDLQARIMTDVPIVPIAMTLTRYVHRASLKGLPSKQPLWGFDFAGLSFSES
jgi:peptide/nickel transport system substrate-binding protein